MHTVLTKEHTHHASYQALQLHDDGDVHVRHVHDDARPQRQLSVFSFRLIADKPSRQVRKTMRVFPDLFCFYGMYDRRIGYIGE